jgi:ketosteroid isomerase-like protein
MASAREISDRYSELINAHDAAGIGELYADDAVFTEPAGEFRGREAIVEYWERFFAAFPDLGGEDTFKAESGDTAINEWSFGGTNMARWRARRERYPRPGSGSPSAAATRSRCATA